MRALCLQGWGWGSKRLSPHLLKAKNPEMAKIGIMLGIHGLKEKETGRYLSAHSRRMEKRPRGQGFVNTHHRTIGLFKPQV